MVARVAVAASLLGAVAAQQTIHVGLSSGNVFQFQPSNITAQANETVMFVFDGTPGNHSVTQSTFSNPCQPAAGGFDSGWAFIPPSNTAAPPTWNLTITNQSQPIWFYCKQLAPSPHCVAGMVGSINAPATGNTFDQFQSNAEKSSGTPGQGEGGLVGIGASASAPLGPFTGSEQGFSNPTGAAAAGASGSNTASGSGASATSPSGSNTASGAGASQTGGAATLAANGFLLAVAGVLGVTLA